VLSTLLPSSATAVEFNLLRSDGRVIGKKQKYRSGQMIDEQYQPIAFLYNEMRLRLRDEIMKIQVCERTNLHRNKLNCPTRRQLLSGSCFFTTGATQKIRTLIISMEDICNPNASVDKEIQSNIWNCWL
jgi:hypothetical protein